MITTDKQIREIRRITLIGLIANLCITAFKISAGWYGNSKAVIADGIHGLSDSITDIIIIAGAKFWSRPPDQDHPYGHRKVEAIVTVIIGIILGFAGSSIAYNSIITIKERDITHPSAIALISAIVSIAVKEILFRWTFAYGKKLKSSVMIANAWHHRSDALSSIPVSIAVAASYLLPEWSSLDNIAAIAVSLFILKAAFDIIKNPVNDLLEKGADTNIVQKIQTTAGSVSGVLGIHQIRSRSVSSAYFIDMHIEVDPKINVSHGCDISKNVKKALLNSDMEIIDVIIHVEPFKKLSREKNEE